MNGIYVNPFFNSDKTCLAYFRVFLTYVKLDKYLYLNSIECPNLCYQQILVRTLRNKYELRNILVILMFYCFDFNSNLCY